MFERFIVQRLIQLRPIDGARKISYHIIEMCSHAKDIENYRNELILLRELIDIFFLSDRAETAECFDVACFTIARIKEAVAQNGQSYVDWDELSSIFDYIATEQDKQNIARAEADLRRIYKGVLFRIEEAAVRQNGSA